MANDWEEGVRIWRIDGREYVEIADLARALDRSYQAIWQARRRIPGQHMEVPEGPKMRHFLDMTGVRVWVPLSRRGRKRGPKPGSPHLTRQPA